LTLEKHQNEQLKAKLAYEEAKSKRVEEERKIRLKEE
jgi:hypothetical protein